MNLNTPITVAMCIALVCSVVFCLEMVGHVGTEELGVKSRTTQFEPWRFITFMFVHEEIWHLLTNLICLILVGLIAWELQVRSSAFLAVFVGVGILTVAPAALLSGPHTFVGASAGGAGLFGAISGEFRRYGLPALPMFVIFLLALLAPLVIEVWSIAVVMEVFMHIFALMLGAVLALWYKAGKVFLR